jgi:hypothetical protein
MVTITERSCGLLIVDSSDMIVLLFFPLNETNYTPPKIIVKHNLTFLFAVFVAVVYDNGH